MKNIVSIILLSLSIVLATNANTFIVTNTNDSGAGSLRHAIESANKHAGADEIRFRIPSNYRSEAQEIALQSPLPFISDPVNINGYSQPFSEQAWDDVSAILKIALNGAAAGAGAYGLSLSDNCTVSGLAIYSFGTAINVAGSNNTVVGCHIGLDAKGRSAIGNASAGIIITGQHNRIGGPYDRDRNVISGNQNGVVVFPYASNNTIQGNFIGTNGNGKVTISSNGFDGIAIGSSYNKILKNVVVGHESNNILISWQFDGSPYPNYNQIQDNWIGRNTDPSSISFDNNCQGISINMAKNTKIRYNTISGLGCHGVSVDGDASIGNLISDNSIYGNLGLAINLGLDWVTANDPGDIDAGPNQLQNFPVLKEASLTSFSTNVEGFMDAPDPRAVLIEFYVSPTPHSSGYGGGKELIGVGKPLDSGKIYAKLPRVPRGSYISAIAIDRKNNTSEFSRSIKTKNAGANATISLSGAKAETEASLSFKAFPNPFVEETSISYRLPEGQSIKLSVFNAAGRLIEVLRDDYQEAGSYEARFDATLLPAGLYFYQLVANGKTHSGKLILK